MKKIAISITTILLLTVLIVVKAQYPFEIYPKINYETFPIEKGIEADSTFIGTAFITDKSSSQFTKIQFTYNRDKDSSNIFIYRNNTLTQKVIDIFDFTPLVMPDSFYVADINNDQILDIKLFCYSTGCGLAGALMRKIYLIGKPDGTFTKFSFMDFSEESERDFNNDGNFEIIGIDHVSYENHSYWVYDIFTLKNGEFINVSWNYNYPIMIQHLYRMNYEVTKLISPQKMKEFRCLKPRWFDERK